MSSSVVSIAAGSVVAVGCAPWCDKTSGWPIHIAGTVGGRWLARGRAFSITRCLDHEAESDYACNAVLSCRACDRAKGAMTIDEWRAALLAGLFTI